MAKEATQKFNLVIPEAVVQAVGVIAAKQNRSIAEMFRRYIKLGLLTDKEPIYIMRDGGFVQVDMES